MDSISFSTKSHSLFAVVLREISLLSFTCTNDGFSNFYSLGCNTKPTVNFFATQIVLVLATRSSFWKADSHDLLISTFLFSSPSALFRTSLHQFCNPALLPRRTSVFEFENYVQKQSIIEFIIRVLGTLSYKMNYLKELSAGRAKKYMMHIKLSIHTSVKVSYEKFVWW